MNTVIQNFVRDRVYEMSDNYHKDYILDMIVSTLFEKTDADAGSLFDFLCLAYANDELEREQEDVFLQLAFLKDHIEENPLVFSDLFINQDWTIANDDDVDE